VVSSSNRQGIAAAVLWLKFNFVGVIGALVQLMILAVCTHWARLPYLRAVMIAVECTIIHNFLWHERFTWVDRPFCSHWERVTRLLRFNFTNGSVSLTGNVLLMRLLVGQFRMPILVANGAAIVACSIINFVLGDQFVFRRPDVPVTMAT